VLKRPRKAGGGGVSSQVGCEAQKSCMPIRQFNRLEVVRSTACRDGWRVAVAVGFW
jgi:hypothetical protein